ncbi:hypothetical protein EBB59_03935 [Lysobacter pythonis]|uniref:Uncharacterized protein n=1 Tax=Solilutibacter pythonis TaxID=2483112 RepID=A0A3M2I082_9GAMM|nr:hypothetical protein EBB59_03935 [Lysobacter pythonis]
MPALAGAGAGSGAGVGAGAVSAAGGGGMGSSFFLQPAMPMVATSAVARAMEICLRFMGGVPGKGEGLGNQGIRSTCPGNILSGSSIWSLLASKIAFHRLPSP